MPPIVKRTLAVLGALAFAAAVAAGAGGPDMYHHGTPVADGMYHHG